MPPWDPGVAPDLQSWQLRPFQSSTTFRLLRDNPDCIFHVVDDVLSVVRTVLEQPDPDLRLKAIEGGWLIENACHWFHLRVTQWDKIDVRCEATAEVRSTGVLRPFWGWNRAKHAVLEATILVTRLHLLGRDQIREALTDLESAVLKTAGPRELAAWELLQQHLSQS